MFPLLFFFVSAFFISFSVSFYLFYKTLNDYKNPPKRQHPQQNDPSLTDDESHKTRQTTPTHFAHSLLRDVLPSNSQGQPGSGHRESGSDGDCERVKKKKKRSKKKRGENDDEENPGTGPKSELVCLYPFTSRSSATQRKIKQQYDQLVKCNESKGLTLAQVGEFAKCLIEARRELQHKSEVIKRKFTIAKALLLKADRSSIDRCRKQINKLELEQKRLEDDAFVYNWLQQQLKLSPAYKKMLEMTECMELKAKSAEPIERKDAEFSEISFEELLAKEKKDAFWQKNGKSRSYST